MAVDHAWLAQSRSDVRALTGRYRRSVVAYSGEDHQRINGWLRRGMVSHEPWWAARVADLDAILARKPLRLPTVLTRTTDLTSFGVTDGRNLIKLVGTAREEWGYLSTTVDADTSSSHRRMIRISRCGERRW